MTMRRRFRTKVRSDSIGGPWHLPQLGITRLVGMCGYIPYTGDIVVWKDIPDYYESCCERCNDIAGV